ncbi:MAG: hypothetical protein A3K19_11670, partial [Lentisphaerae bacterium RIFOXYB12_FULL_65_16]
DVVVAGGGPAGFPAAIAAARRGCKVLLLERYGFLGGLATGGLMGPIFGYGSGKTLLLGGIPIEVLRELQAIDGAPRNVDNWFGVRFDPELLKHAADRMVTKAGVQLLLHAWVVAVVRKNDRIDAVVIESKSGRQAVRTKMVIDATGDGDVAVFCGCEYTKGRVADGKTQSMGTKFRIGGVDMKNVMAHHAEERQNVNRAIDEGRIPAYHAFFGEVSEQGVTLRDTEITPTATRCPGDGTNAYDLTRAELKARRDTLDMVEYYRQNVRGYENCYLIDTPAVIGVRETRQILGLETVTGADVLANRKREDSIARGCWFIDIHCPLGRHCSKTNLCDKNCKITPDCHMKTKHRDQLYDTLCQSGFNTDNPGWYDVPYGSLIPRTVDNLLVSGRCISADPGGMASVRVIATCFALGEAAGAAAALCLQKKRSPRELPVQALQQDLRAAGVPL